MSRVIINEVCNMDYGTSRNKILDVEVVPRKMVEMIIEKAKEECADVNNSYYSRKINHIWEYAESLLKQFEEETK